MKALRKKFLTLPLSIFFLMLYSGVYLSSGLWHHHENGSANKTLSYSKSENCDYCKLISSDTFDAENHELLFQKNTLILFSPSLTENTFSASLLNQHNRAPPVKA
ncbi:MAG: hypothetical protein ACKOXB_04355 [Flavobacteriales bacterium]